MLFLTKLRANSGSVKAQFELGQMFYNGRDVPQDYFEAIKWFKMAAEKGVSEAQYILGEIYSMGLGVQSNQTEAIKYYSMAAEQGDINSQLFLGDSYFFGRITVQDMLKRSNGIKKQLRNKIPQHNMQQE